MVNRGGAKTAKKRSLASRVTLGILVLAVVAIAVVIWSNRTAVSGYADVGSAYAARVACSCRFVAGRDLDDCTKDKLAGMELVSLSEDVDAQSVTATFALVTSNTATYREGYGCVMEEWEG